MRLVFGGIQTLDLKNKKIFREVSNLQPHTLIPQPIFLSENVLEIPTIFRLKSLYSRTLPDTYGACVAVLNW